MFLVRFLMFESPLKKLKSDYNQTWVKDAIGVLNRGNLMKLKVMSRRVIFM